MWIRDCGRIECVGSYRHGRDATVLLIGTPSPTAILPINRATDEQDLRGT